jgi:hypothetical protein
MLKCLGKENASSHGFAFILNLECKQNLEWRKSTLKQPHLEDFTGVSRDERATQTSCTA